MLTLTCKRGDTLTIAGQHTDIAGDSASLTGTTVASAMQLGAVRVVLLATVVNASQGTFSLSLTPVQTAALSVGLWSSDVEFTNASGDVTSTDTFLISIAEDITNGPS